MKRELKKAYQAEMDEYILDLEHFGIYQLGLEASEIDKYLRVKAKKSSKYKKYSTKQLRKVFNKISGVNAMVVVTCPKCSKEIVLMYRDDVRRFADYMFQGIKTYWN